MYSKSDECGTGKNEIGTDSYMQQVTSEESGGCRYENHDYRV